MPFSDALIGFAPPPQIVPEIARMSPNKCSSLLKGKSKTIKFTPKEPGEYPFFCQVANHSKKGMTGTLVVQK